MCLFSLPTGSSRLPIFVDVLPNQCATFQTGSFPIAFCFINKVARQHSHKLYRKDTAISKDYYATFLHNIKSDMIDKGIMLCPYYYGRYVISSVPACKTTTCSHQNGNISVIQARDYKLKICSSDRETLIETELIEYPSSTNYKFTNLKGTLEHLDSTPQMTSTIYHINCLQSPEKIAMWSGFNLTLIGEICMNDNFKRNLSLYNISEYNLQPPYPDNNYSELWKLEISFSGCFGYMDNYGYLIFNSHPTKRLCNITQIKEFERTYHYHYKLQKQVQCYPFKTVAHLNSALLKDTKMFQLGFLKFDTPSITYYANMSLTHRINTCELHYKWIPSKKIEEKHFNKFQSTLKLLQYVDEKYSWEMAATKCKDFGMSLPHFYNERSTRQFVSFILNQFPLPTHSLFIGLIYKASSVTVTSKFFS